MSKPHRASREGQSGTPFLTALQSSKPIKDFSKQEPVSINLHDVPDAPSLCKSRSSGHSKGSLRSKTTTVSEADKARVKLELARSVQRQNEERLRLEGETEQRRAEMEANIRRQELEMKRLKILAEDQRKVEVAELEASLYQNRTSDDEVSNFWDQSSCQNPQTRKPSSLLQLQPKMVTFQTYDNPSQHHRMVRP